MASQKVHLGKRAREAGKPIKLGKQSWIRKDILKNILFSLPFQRWNNIIREDSYAKKRSTKIADSVDIMYYENYNSF